MFTIIKLSLKCGHKAGYAFIAGVAASDLLLVVLGNVAAELVSYALAYKLYIAAAGAGLLIIMGIYSLFFRKDPVMDNSELPAEYSNLDMLKFTIQGFFVNILNPAPFIFGLLLAPLLLTCRSTSGWFYLPPVWG